MAHMILNQKAHVILNQKKHYKFLMSDEKINYMIGLQEENLQKNNTILNEIRKYLKIDDAGHKKEINETVTASKSKAILCKSNNVMSIKNFNELELLEEQLKSVEFKNETVCVFHCF